jgi:hypothetical protein
MPRTKRKALLFRHESDLVDSGFLQDITHDKASSKWLFAASTTPALGRVVCYRQMGEVEVQCLLQTHRLPSTQPHQTLTRGEDGRRYCEKYLRSNKTVDTNPQRCWSLIAQWI